jgi:AhpD family alkylhydroperoxidase
MSRMAGVPDRQAGPVVRLVYRLTRRETNRIAGRELGQLIEPIGIYAHAPRLLVGYGIFEKAVASRPRVEERLRALAVLKAAALQGCEFCLDIGSREARRAGISDRQVLDLHRYAESEHFDDTERLVLDLAVGMTRTPVQVGDGLFAALRERFDEAQIVELVNLVALENLRSRFNAAFGLGPTGFSDGAVCARREVPADAQRGAGETESGQDAAQGAPETSPPAVADTLTA